MALHSLWGASAPPGTYAWYTDGTPSVYTGHGFYRGGPAGNTAGWTVAGGRVWVTAAMLAATSTVTFRVFRGGQYNAALSAVETGFNAPVESKSLTITATGWASVMFNSPFVPDHGERVYVMVQYGVTTGYLHGGSTAGASVQASDGSSFYLGTGSEWRSVLKIGSNSVVGGLNDPYYGVDILFDDNAGGGSTTGTVAGTLPKVTGSVAGASLTTGTLSASLPKVTGSTSGASITTGTVNASLPKITGSITGESLDLGTIDGTLPKVTSSINGTVTVTGTVSGSLPKVTGSTSGAVVVAGALSGALPKVTASISGTMVGATPTIAEENANSTGVQGKEYWFNYPNDAIPGFPRSSYFAPGETARFSVSYSTAYTVQIWRLGWYGGQNARKVAEFAGTPVSQPAATVIPNSNGAVTCAAWAENVTWDIPGDATPGWYWAFMRNAGSDAFGGMLFCVTDELAPQPILVVASEATWHAAYNGYGGSNVYGASTGIGSISGRAYCSTYDKPIISRDNVPQTHFFNGELAQLRFLERFGFDVGYATCEQINNDPSIMDGRDLIIFSGHNEYISTRIWDKTIEVLASGTNIANFAANDFFWRVAYGSESGFPVGATDTSTGRVMWCRKDTMTGPTGSGHTAGTPFTTQADWTGTWQDTRYVARRPSTGLLGDRFIANGIRADNVKVPFAMKGLPIWRDAAAVQALTTGQEWSAGAGTAGMEWDMPEGPLPSTALSASVVDLTDNSSDVNGENYNLDGTYTHAFQMVRSSAAYVFNANTTQWGWALDDLHLRGSALASATAVQATLNVLYDLGARGVTALFTTPYVEPTAVSDVGVAYNLVITITGSVAGTLPKVTGSAAGASLTTGTVAGTLAPVTGAVAGTSITIGSLNAALPKVTGAISGTSFIPGTLNGVLPPVAGTLTGTSFIPGTLNGVLPAVTGATAGDTPVIGGISAPLPRITAELTGLTTTIGELNGQLPAVRSDITGAGVVTGELAGALPRITGTITEIVPTTGTLLGTLPRIRGSVSIYVPPGEALPLVIVLSRGRRRPKPIRLTRYRRD